MANPKHFPDKAERRRRRDMGNPPRHEKPVRSVRSKWCRCPEACHLHGKFQPLHEESSDGYTGN